MNPHAWSQLIRSRSLLPTLLPCSMASLFFDGFRSVWLSQRSEGNVIGLKTVANVCKTGASGPEPNIVSMRAISTVPFMVLNALYCNGMAVATTLGTFFFCFTLATCSDSSASTATPMIHYPWKRLPIPIEDFVEGTKEIEHNKRLLLAFRLSCIMDWTCVGFWIIDETSGSDCLPMLGTSPFSNCFRCARFWDSSGCSAPQKYIKICILDHPGSSFGTRFGRRKI